MTWRYQMVFEREPSDDDSGAYSLCEVYLNDDGTLRGWSDQGCAPWGDDMTDFIGDLSLMMDSASKWEPVKYSDLKVGMTFVPRKVDIEVDTDE